MTKRLHTAYSQVAPFITKDGSVIRELMHPGTHGNRGQSLAEAMVPPGAATVPHRHHRSEEIYHITAGEGRMRLGDEEFAVTVGDTICIPPGVPHSLSNPGQGELRLLCCSSPPYDDEDTELLEKPPKSSP
jgi:mannose-6-phosphate isomerase-like protein (cupin superfamily)